AWIGSAARIRSDNRMLHVMASVAAGMAFTVLTLVLADRTIRIPVEINKASAAAFTTTLSRSLVKPALVTINCAQHNPQACVLAEQMIPLLQRAGWAVKGPAVYPITLGRDSAEVV